MPFLETEKIIEAVSVNDSQSSFYGSELIRNKLIDYYVPFLPMSEEEIECCVDFELATDTWFNQRGVLEKRTVMDKILKSFHYLTHGDLSYADSGCKHTKKAVSLFA